MPYITDLGLDSDLRWDSQPAVRFRRETRHIVALVRRYLPQIKHERIWKVNIICVRQHPLAEPIVVGGVLDVPILMDITSFDSFSLQEKKEFALNALDTGIGRSISTRYIEAGVIEKALQKAKAIGLVNHWKSPRKRAPDHKHFAFLECVHEASTFEATLIITDRKKLEIFRAPAICARPSEHDYGSRIKSLAWRDNNTVTVDGRIFRLTEVNK